MMHHQHCLANTPPCCHVHTHSAAKIQPPAQRSMLLPSRLRGGACPTRSRQSGAALCRAASSPLGGSVSPGNRPVTSAASTSLPIRIIGIGPRAASVLPRLADAHTGVSSDVHYIDWGDAKNVDSAGPTALLKADCAHEDALEELLDTNDIDRMCGPVVFEDGTAGCAVVFVLASATDGPPGAARVTAELTRALRNAGHFTVAVLTLPFEFEGQKKIEAGGALLEELQDIAHTTVAVEQALLTANTQGMTVTASQAMGIADGALEHAVRGVTTALRVPELLVLANGGAAWHGKARGNLRQRMSTPLQQLLTRPGTVALGRGLAGMRAALPASTDGTALQCLAADAVAAAADSPFLQGSLKDAAGLLCSISLPASVHSGASARLAIQAAAGGLMEALGNSPVAKTMLICAHSAVDNGEQEGIAVEATIMVVRPPLGNHTLPSTRIQMAPPPPKSKAVVPPRRATGTSAAAPGARLPSSVWGAMSALAGGTASAPAPRAPPRPTPTPAPTPRPLMSKEPVKPPASNVVPVRSQPLPPPRTRPLLRPDQLPSQTTTAHDPSPAPKDSTIGDLLASSLNVRSLDLPRHTPDAPPQWPDLPPRAAIWRMQQRPVLEVTEEVEDEGGAMSGWLPWATGRKGGAHPPSQASARAWSILGDEGEDF